VAATDSIAAIVLAAGMSQRMGDINKLHLNINGMPLLKKTINTLLDAGVNDVTVVLGYESKATQILIDELPVKTVLNGDYEQGQMSSVHCGLSTLPGTHGGVIIALADQPYLQAQDIEHLCQAFLQRDTGDVAVPFFNNERGNPIIISEACRQSILSGERNLGCRRFIEKNPELVYRVEMPDAAVLGDLDTPEDYQHFIEVGV
jgi:molybdenum cofactor cytidylyltransferase